MRLHCEFSTPVARTDLDDYVRNLEITIGCYDEDCLPRVHRWQTGDGPDSLGRRHRRRRFPLRDLRQRFPGLARGPHHPDQGEGAIPARPAHPRIHQPRHVPLRNDLSSLHPPVPQGILDAAFNMLGEESLAVMWKDTSGLSESDLSDLGFCKIAGSDLIFRHSTRRNKFNDQFPAGQDADVAALPEHEEWVEEEWKRFTGSGGSQ